MIVDFSVCDRNRRVVHSIQYEGGCKDSRNLWALAAVMSTGYTNGNRIRSFMFTAEAQKRRRPGAHRRACLEHAWISILN